MRFTKIFIATKPGMHKDMKRKIEKFLDEKGINHTSQPEPHINFAITIGGDGTLLRHQNRFKCPFLGINGGSSVGHYLSAGPDDYLEKVEKAIFGFEDKDYKMLHLTRLITEINGEVVEDAALNEVNINPVYTRRMLRTEVTVNNETSLELNTCILAYTPSGSTAFASSIDVKEMKWESRFFGIAAVAPYAGSLKEGPKIAHEPVSVIIMKREAEACIDGQENQVHKLKEGDEVIIKKHDVPLRLVWF